MSLREIYYNSGFGTFVTHYLKEMSLYIFPDSFPMFLYSISIIGKDTVGIFELLPFS